MLPFGYSDKQSCSHDVCLLCFVATLQARETAEWFQNEFRKASELPFVGETWGESV